MLYTNAMTNMLNKIDENTAKLMVHYLDRFMETQEEPTFKGIELKKYWFLLLVDGLINEIKQGSNPDVAMIYLTKLLNYNNKCFENKNYVAKTINEVESKVTYVCTTDKSVVLKDPKGITRKISLSYVNKFCKNHNIIWEEDRNIRPKYIYELYVEYRDGEIKNKPIKDAKLEEEDEMNV